MNTEGLNNVDKNKSAYIEMSSSHTLAVRGVSLPPSYRLVRVKGDDDSFQIALLSDESEEVAYYIECNALPKFRLIKSIIRVSVWRTAVIAHRRVISGLTEKLFDDHLLDSYMIIFQTNDSIDFIKRQLGHALANGNTVYKYNWAAHELEELDQSKIRNISSNLCFDENQTILISRSQFQL